MSIPRNLGNFADNVDTNGQVSLTTGVTGTLPVANGGSGSTTSTGSGANVLATSPTLVTPALGTPASGVLTNATGLPLTTGVTGTLPVANGGTGAATLTANNVLLGNGTSALQVVAPGANGNILTSNGTTWTSSTPAGGGVTSLNGQTGAITNTTLDSIGSVIMAANGSTSNILAGTTITGSSLYYPTTITQTSDPGNLWSNGTNTVAPRYDNTTQWTDQNGLNNGQSRGYAPFGVVVRSTSGNTGWQAPLGASTLSGTWRCMGWANARMSRYTNDCNGNWTASSAFVTLWVRVS